MNIAQALKATRTSRGESKSAAMRALGTTRPTYDAWEAGLYTPSEVHEPALAAYLGIPEVRVAQYCGRIGERQANALLDAGITDMCGYITSGLEGAYTLFDVNDVDVAA